MWAAPSRILSRLLGDGCVKPLHFRAGGGGIELATDEQASARRSSQPRRRGRMRRGRRNSRRSPLGRWTAEPPQRSRTNRDAPKRSPVRTEPAPSPASRPYHRCAPLRSGRSNRLRLRFGRRCWPRSPRAATRGGGRRPRGRSAPPSTAPARWNRSSPAASAAARTSPANVSSRYGPGGESDRPWPRVSTATMR